MKIVSFLKGGGERTTAIRNNVIGSGLLKGINILTSLLLVPLTINYVNPTRYGIWLTLSTIIGWVGYFDLGLTLGFKNRFAESIAIKDYVLAREYVSTTYTLMAIIFCPLMVILLFANQFVNWTGMINVPKDYAKELQKCVDVLIVCFCMNMILKTVCVMLDAYMKTAVSSLIQTSGQVAALLMIYVMTLNSQGTLSDLALAYSATPLLVILLSTLIVFRNDFFNSVVPSFIHVRFNLIGKVLNLGLRFFVITLSMLFIFQIINIVISRNLGPDTVSEYNIAYKYFSVLLMVTLILLNPMWVGFTDAYTKNDKVWMTKAISTLEKIAIIELLIIGIMAIASPVVLDLWIGDKILISQTTIIIVCLYVFLQIVASMYMYIINGTGKVMIQTIVYSFFALMAPFVMDYCCKLYGLLGVLIIPSVVYVVQALLGKVQITKLVNGTATGIWNK